jgi:hypothetical protein
MSWANRVRNPAGSPPLRQVQTAAENLAEQVGLAPGKARVVFQTVADAAIIISAVTATTLAAVHLYKALFPKHKEEHRGPETAGGDHSPPRHRGPRTAAAADGQGGHKDDRHRFR